MEQCEENSQENDDVIIEKEISKLIEEQRLFTESIYACLPVGIEIYDAHGVLRSINDHALRMYGVDDRTSVVNIVNLYKSPFVDSELLAGYNRVKIFPWSLSMILIGLIRMLIILPIIKTR